MFVEDRSVLTCCIVWDIRKHAIQGGIVRCPAMEEDHAGVAGRRIEVLTGLRDQKTGIELAWSHRTLIAQRLLLKLVTVVGTAYELFGFELREATLLSRSNSGTRLATAEDSAKIRGFDNGLFARSEMVHPMGMRCCGRSEGGSDLIDNEGMDVAKERGLRHLEDLGLLDFLRMRREELGLSQEEASRRIGLASHSHFGHFERGTRDVQIEYIRPMADMLEVPAGLILEKYLRHMYGSGQDRWILDELYSPDLAVAHKLKRLSEEEKKGIAMMVDLFLSKNQ